MNAQDLYSKIAGLYDISLWLNGYKFAIDFIIGRLPFGPRDSFKVLDAGCGTGLYSIAILKRFPNAQITAFDLNENMIAKMKMNLIKNGFEKRATVFAGNVLERDFNNERDFDLIITGGVLEYVAIQQAVLNLSHHLRTNGYFLNSPVSDNWLGRFIGKLEGFVPHTKEKNVSAFTQNGFDLVRSIRIPFLYFPICLVKSVHILKKTLPTQPPEK